MVRCQYRLVNTLGLYVNTLEYTELLNKLNFDKVYESYILSSLLCTLAYSNEIKCCSSNVLGGHTVLIFHADK